MNQPTGKAVLDVQRKSYPTNARTVSAIATTVAARTSIVRFASSAFRSGLRAGLERAHGRSFSFSLSAPPPCISTFLGRATPTNRTSSPEMKLMAFSDHPNKLPTSSQPRRSPRTS